MTALPSSSANETIRKPWKFKGYPVLAAWMASSDDFFMIRRFGELNTRAVLFMQDEIVRKETNLKSIDERARLGPDKLGVSSTFRKDPQTERAALILELIPLLHRYNEYLVAFSQVKSWPSAAQYQVENMQNWFWNNRGAIADEEQEFIQRGIDVIALVSRPKSPLYLLLEKCEFLVTSRLFRISAGTGQAVSDSIYYHKEATLEAFVTAVIITVGLCLLLGPMWVLQFMADNVKRLGTITGFVLLFTVLLSCTTVAKPFEVLAATAAYAAVLMVFLQVGSNTTQVPET